MINIVICDDSKDYLEIIAYKIEQCMQTQIKMEYSLTLLNTLTEFQKHIETNKVDILFLDIMLKEENVMDWSIKNLKFKYTQIIFMTAFPQSAYNISETNCCYFLIKSKITQENLTKALRRALQNNIKKDPNLTVVKSGNKNHIVNIQDIKFIETFNNNLILNIKGMSKITIYSTLKEYAKKLPPNFLRCHKSFMVNMNHIVGYEPYEFIIDSTDIIPIPPKKYAKVIDSYTNYLNNL